MNPMKTREEALRHIKENGLPIAGPMGKIHEGSIQASRFAMMFSSKDEKNLDGIEQDAGPNAIPITHDLQDILTKELEQRESEYWKLAARKVTRTFVYFDISDFSKFKDGQQMLAIKYLIHLMLPMYWDTGMGKAIFGRNGKEPNLEAMLCIGDGYIYAFKTAPHAIYFAAWLATLIERAIAKKVCFQEIHFRMGIHTGETYFFWDPGRNGWNYVGGGINGGQRILSAVGKQLDDVIFLSQQTREALLRDETEKSFVSQVLEHLHSRGRQKDKHGNMWRVYLLNHMQTARGPSTDYQKIDEGLDAGPYGQINSKR